MSESKPLPPTPQKIEKERKKGKVLQSNLFSQIFGTIGFLACAPLWGEAFWNSFIMLLHCGDSSYYGVDFLGLSRAGESFISGIMSTCFGVVVPSVATGLVLSRCNFTLDAVRPKFSRLAFSLERLFSGFRRIGFDLVSFFVGTSIAVVCVAFALSFAVSDSFRIHPSGSLFGAAIVLLALFSALTLVAGGVDLLRAYRERQRDLRMSYREAREEERQESGDPLLNAMRRSHHQLLSLEEVEDRVKKAKFVVVRRTGGKE